jgi:hypothetical protein
MGCLPDICSVFNDDEIEAIILRTHHFLGDNQEVK